ncbi:unnamed protein product [Didymodactylos carnosus]|uniref:Integrase zinc-binding domain-containing protein n=1 Tax=Didymodactylos carnosus TaxID=1234261 RepID=A0A814AGV0_9BILA|nr:unnamed protein product [Didymodactylos carnosus]CAF3692651.1 unnamed protein product [Didymodactylos carnosus]CAF4132726.1 unnamed protein product [Didymodactylos carnosus]
MVQTRQQLRKQEEFDQLQVSEELKRLSVIEVDQINNPTEQQHIVYGPISFMMTEKLVNSILSNNLEKLPKFGGKRNENVKKWLLDITNELNLVNLNDHQKPSVIQTFLLDDARRWFINNMSVITEWSIFTIQIQKTFSSTLHQELAIKKIGARQQGLDETILHYYNDMMDTDMNGQLKVAYLKAGLKVSLKKDVMRQDPKTPAQFLEVAQVEEKLNSSLTMQMDNVQTSHTSSVSTIKSPIRSYPQQLQQPSQSSSKARCYRCNRNNIVQLTIYNPTKKLVTLPRRMFLETIDHLASDTYCSTLFSNGITQECDVNQEKEAQTVPLNTITDSLSQHLKINEQQYQQLLNFLQEHRVLFDTSQPRTIKTKIHHVIDTGEHSSVNAKPYFKTIDQRKNVQQEIDKMLKSGIIVPSHSPRLNSITKNDSYPQPTVEELLLRLGGHSWFTKLDLKNVFSVLSEHRFTLNPDKCSLAKQPIEFLSHTITKDAIIPSKERIQATLDIPQPTTLAQANKFFGKIGWYRKFIPKFTELAAPIHKVTNKTKKKKREFYWHEDSFFQAANKLKQVLTEEPLVLKYPHPTAPFILATDASESQIQKSRNHDDADGMSRPEVNDQQPSLNIMTRSMTKTVVCRTSNSNDNESISITNDDTPVSTVMTFDFSFERISEEQKRDPQIAHIRKQLSRRNTSDPTYIIENDVLYKMIRLPPAFTKTKLIYIPLSMQEEVIRCYHDHPTGAHFGLNRTWLKLRKSCYWLGTKKIVQNYIRFCDKCARFNVRRTKAPGHSLPIEYAQGALELIGMHF